MSETALDSASSEGRLKLSPHAALKTRAEGDILVLPERAMRLGGSGGEILRLCLEPRSLDAIVSTLAARHSSVNEEMLRDSVRSFLDEMLELGGVIPAGSPDDGEAEGDRTS